MNRTQKITRRMEALRRIIEHPTTKDGERSAAQHALHRLLANNPDTQRLTADDTTALFPVTIGDRYDSSLDIRDIAAILRREFQLRRKVARTSGGTDLALIDPIGDLPAEVKISVRIERGSIHDILIVNLKNTPENWWAPEGPYIVPGRELRRVGQEISDTVQAFNYDGSDPRFDHVNVRFIGRVTADHRTI